jgi:uncharacterized membrane protein YeaQ/YmgE (transglycosylase-associated protein family)
MGAESWVWFLLALAIVGLIVGAVARVLVPGPTPLGILGTIGVGIAGAFIGGIVGRLLFGPHLTQGWNFVLSVLGAALVVALVSGPGRTYYYARRPPRRVVSDVAYDDEIVVEEPAPPYRGVRRRRRRFF